jgi:hypothetical protein
LVERTNGFAAQISVHSRPTTATSHLRRIDKITGLRGGGRTGDLVDGSTSYIKDSRPAGWASPAICTSFFLLPVIIEYYPCTRLIRESRRLHLHPC